MSTVRLNKYLAERVHCSRRQADDLIEEGRVRVNGAVAELGARVDPDSDNVEVNGKSVGERRPAVYLIYNKPVGVICTTDVSMPDNVIARIGHKERIFYVGRLDVESSGLLLLTNDGRIVNSLLRGSGSQEKEYKVQVDRPYDQAFLEAMVRGVDIGDPTPTKPARMKPLKDDTFHIVLTEGRNRQIRRMCDALGYEVRRLSRLRFGHLTLDGLPEDKWRALTPPEVQRLLQEAGYIKPPAPLASSQRSAAPRGASTDRGAPRYENQRGGSSRERQGSNPRDPWASRRYQGREDRRHRDGWREPTPGRSTPPRSQNRDNRGTYDSRDDRHPSGRSHNSRGDRPNRSRDDRQRHNRPYDSRDSRRHGGGPRGGRGDGDSQWDHTPRRNAAPSYGRRRGEGAPSYGGHDSRGDGQGRAASPRGPSYESGRHRKGPPRQEAQREERPRTSPRRGSRGQARGPGRDGERQGRGARYEQRPALGGGPETQAPSAPRSRNTSDRKGPSPTQSRARKASPPTSPRGKAPENPWARARIRSNYGQTAMPPAPTEGDSETKDQ